MNTEQTGVLVIIAGLIGGIMTHLANAWIAARAARSAEKLKHIESQAAPWQPVLHFGEQFIQAMQTDMGVLRARVYSLETDSVASRAKMAEMEDALAASQVTVKDLGEALEVTKKKLAATERKLDAAEESNRELKLINGNLRQNNEALLEQMADRGVLMDTPAKDL